MSTWLTDALQESTVDYKLLQKWLWALDSRKADVNQASWCACSLSLQLGHLTGCLWCMSHRRNPSLPLTNIPAFLGPGNILVSAGSSYRREFVAPLPPTGWNVRSKEHSLAWGTKWLPILPIGILGKVPVKLRDPDLWTGRFINWNSSTEWWGMGSIL